MDHKVGLELALVAIMAVVSMILMYNSYKRSRFISKSMKGKNRIYNDIPEYDTDMDSDIAEELEKLLEYKEKRLASLIDRYVTTGSMTAKDEMEHCYTTISNIRDELTIATDVSTPVINTENIYGLIDDEQHKRVDRVVSLLDDIESQLTHKRR